MRKIGHDEISVVPSDIQLLKLLPNIDSRKRYVRHDIDIWVKLLAQILSWIKIFTCEYDPCV